MSTTQTTMSHPALITALEAAATARLWHLEAARRLEAADLHVIAHAFRFTAAQEAEHAAMLRLFTGAALPDVAAPALPGEPNDLLHTALTRETACAESVFPEAAREAEAAGLPRIAVALQRMAETEAAHARRFGQYLHALEEGDLLGDSKPLTWLCLPCGSLHHGCAAPDRCDNCGASRGHFIRSSLHPFAVG